MNSQKEEFLFNKFKFFKPEKGLTKTLMVYGFTCDDGWYNLILGMCNNIQKLIDEKPRLYENFEIVQVKQKFGSLRVYFKHGTSDVGDIIAEAENESCKICEKCGSRDKVHEHRKGMYVQSICTECAKDGYIRVNEVK